MAVRTPTNAWMMMTNVYRSVFPQVRKELDGWITKAKAIPNQELRKQALASIAAKTFHCEGGSIYSLLAADQWKQAIKFIVAYQTISDYLDNLCDRSTSMDPKDFRMLHQAMTDALTPGNPVKNYYQFREDQNDGGYLESLVQTCQQVLTKPKDYQVAHPQVVQLGNLYNDLQVHKHVVEEERVPRLQTWFSQYEAGKHLKWYEFSACTGSTLGIFCLVSYTLGGKMNGVLAKKVAESYFPFLQGLHILLDYYIDQQEDEMEGDLNFCSYYETDEEMRQRFVYFVKETKARTKLLPDPEFHEMIQEGLVGMYLADRKVSRLQNAKTFVRDLLKVSGRKAKFFHYNTKVYHMLKPGKSL
ncbi:tetraprenyl-beta-curcumene synthase [Thalassobacillus cyri]|uniref:Tetraprenyl-beta-curcumene synthase n=1 Tax=Thalassobacillus cyri TaxID=571932 RepID=A0A1H4G4H7_9BACI|nr:tetraprenyl-beta-curcumene synthase family protein [Thalassobacillus cyri]SEB04526.1 tetraprenyl-beta-curcumene synthase [Thalassobacillus cyri]